MGRLVRNTALALALGLALAGLAATAPAAGQVYRLYVDGLACPFCAYGIEKQLSALEGVEKVEVDIRAGAVTVTAAEGRTLSDAALRRAVNDAGFSLRKVEGPIAGREEHD